MADRPCGAGDLASESGWRREFEETLPDLKDEDIAGSGFAIQNYTVHVDLGGDAALARLRQRLQKRGLKLMLDFVPNHMAPDHPWIDEHPGYFVHGSEAELRSLTSELLSCPELQQAMIGELERIARAVRRRALRYGYAGLARRVRKHLGHPG